MAKLNYNKTAQATPSEEDAWKGGNWEDTWKQAVPEGKEKDIPDGWETIKRSGHPGMIFGRPPQGKDLTS